MSETGQQLGGISPEAFAQAQAQAAAAAIAEAKSVSGVHTFALTDHDDVEHVYMVTLHGTDSGQRILWTLIGLGGEPLGAMMQSAVGRWLASGADLSELLDKPDGAAEMFAEVDWAAVGLQVSTAVARADMPGLVALILRHTMRDGKYLADKAAFNAAYQANYLEMLKAVGAVLQANHLVPF